MKGDWISKGFPESYSIGTVARSIKKKSDLVSEFMARNESNNMFDSVGVEKWKWKWNICIDCLWLLNENDDRKDMDHNSLDVQIVSVEPRSTNHACIFNIFVYAGHLICVVNNGRLSFSVIFHRYSIDLYYMMSQNMLTHHVLHRYSIDIAMWELGKRHWILIL